MGSSHLPLRFEKRIERNQDEGCTRADYSYVTALHARVPLTIYDPSPSVLSSALSKLDSLLAKDVEKKRITQDVATRTRELVQGVQGDGTEGSQVVDGVDLVIEVGENSLRPDGHHPLAALPTSSYQGRARPGHTPDIRPFLRSRI